MIDMSKTEQVARRGFLFAGVSVLAANTLPKITASSSAERETLARDISHGAHNKNERGAVLEAIGAAGPNGLEDMRAVLTKNALTGVLFASAKLLTQEVFNHLKIDSAHFMQHESQKQYLELLRSAPLDTIFTTCLAAPIIEEVVFRLLPSQYADRNENMGLAWNIGIPISAVFALMHNITQDRSKPFLKSFSFDTESFSVPAFAAGLVFWYLQRTYGIQASMIAHIASNSTQTSVQIAKLLMTATSDIQVEGKPESSSKID